LRESLSANKKQNRTRVDITCIRVDRISCFEGCTHRDTSELRRSSNLALDTGSVDRKPAKKKDEESRNLSKREIRDEVEPFDLQRGDDW
jgi:hypothetical protein